tara:strand:- start:2181 stop:2372 length:192 start_codon:yes stop_codon:yes gene_type:complete
MELQEKIKSMPDLLKVNEVADILRVSAPTVKRWINEGQIEASQFHDKGSYRIQKTELQKLITG